MLRLFALLALVCVSACAPNLSGVYGFVRGQNFGRDPVRIADQLYYVGDRDTAVYALDTSDGIILIDGGYTDTARRVFDNMREMRLDPSRVRAILTTQAHFDHAAGLAYLHQQTRAPIYASAESADLLASGGERDFSRLMRTYFRFPKIVASEIVTDRQPLQFGNLTITAHITRGHTRGCTTWTFPVTIDGAPHNALLLCSLHVLPQYQLTGVRESYPGIVEDFRRSFARLDELCPSADIFLAVHGSEFDFDRKADAHAFVEPGACAEIVAENRAHFDDVYRRQSGAAR